MNYSETLNYIHSLGNFSYGASLSRITEILNKFNNPQNDVKTIHIAGTNGKGSVSTMLSGVYQKAGLKTGLFISPFVIDFRERIQINGEFISESDIIEIATEIISKNIGLTEFEFITCLAFLYFKRQNCDIAIIETGLGGRFDATNTINKPLATVITKIGLDHTAILGDTIEKITAEKCGILRDCPTITSPYQHDGAISVIKECDSNVIIPDLSQLSVISSDDFGNDFIYKGKEYHTSLSGLHQIENALCVIETIYHAGIRVNDQVIHDALANTHFPARLEVISKNPLVILDGAHNPDGAEALAHFMKKYDGQITAIIGVMKDKNYQKVLELTLPYCKYAVAVTVDGMPRSLKANELMATAEKICNCETANNYEEAIRIATSKSGGNPIFVFGSLYLASGIRDNLYRFLNNF